MNIRLGFARIARATAISYAIISVLVVAALTKSALDQRSQILNAPTWETTASDGRTFSLRAEYGWEAQTITDDYAEKNPRTNHPRKTYLDSTDLFEATPSYSGPRIHLHVPKYDDASPSFRPVMNVALLTSLWCIVVYVGFWAFFRAVKWIALGFLEKPRPAET